jgi:phosphoesterase RecJ-like protein
MDLKTVISHIKKHRSFIVCGHVNPDPDALCSMLAIRKLLQNLGKQVRLVNNDVPLRWKDIPGINTVHTYDEKTKGADALIIVDCGSIDRIGRVAELMPKVKAVINIDHHVTNTKFGDVTYVDLRASSTSEIIFQLFKEAKVKIDRAAAHYLYAGIMTDTGSFRYENTTPRTHEIAAELLTYGLQPSGMYSLYYEMLPARDAQLFCKVLNKFESLQEGHVLIVELSAMDIKKFSPEFDMKDMIFQFLRSIKGVELIIIFTAVSAKETRVNFRSSKRVDVAKLAASLGGGGHRRASGCTLSLSLKSAKRRVLEHIGEGV